MSPSITPDPAAAAAIAAHRFGLGEPDLAVLGTDARAWLQAQIGPADPQRGAGRGAALPSLAEALARQLAARAADAGQLGSLLTR